MPESEAWNVSGTFHHFAKAFRLMLHRCVVQSLGEVAESLTADWLKQQFEINASMQ